MDPKKINLLWTVSLIVIVVITLFLVLTEFIVQLPLPVKIILNILDYVGLAALIYSSVKKFGKK